MNQAIRFSLLIFALLLQACSNQNDSPSINFANSKAVSQASFNGQWLVINYWAVWCKPCIEEIPELNALNKNHDDIQVIGVNFDQPNTEANLAAIKKLGIKFPVSETNLQALYQYQMPQALPTTVIISGDGTVKHELIGPQSEKSILAIIHPENKADNKQAFKGTVKTQENQSLPENTVLKIQLWDNSKQDVKAELVAQQIITNPSSLPESFELAVNPKKLQPKRLYNLRASIYLKDKLIFTSTESLNPLNAEDPESLVINLQAIN